MRRQLLLNFEGGATLISEVVQGLTKFLNRELPRKGVKVRIDGIRQAYKGYTLATLGVATEADTELIRGGIDHYLFLSGTLPRKAFTLQLPQSRAFLRLVDVPYWNSVTNVGDVMSADHLKRYIRDSPVADDLLGALASELRIHHTSTHSATSTVFFDIWIPNRAPGRSALLAVP